MHLFSNCALCSEFLDFVSNRKVTIKLKCVYSRFYDTEPYYILLTVLVSSSLWTGLGLGSVIVCF